MATPQPARAIAAAVLLVLVMASIYTTGLNISPPYLMHDELQFSLQARSIAESGRDLSGRLMPVFFTEPEFPPGRDPVLIYFTAAVLEFVSFSQEHVKLAVALIGLLNIGLMFAAGWLLLGSPWAGLLAAALLALTPIHFIRARMVLSPFMSIPFVLGWLIALGLYLRSGSRRSLIAAAACCALSVYSYLACVVMAPVYLAITAWIAVRREGRKVIAPMAMTVAVLLAPMVIWYVTQPERYSQLVDAYRLYGSGTGDNAPAAPMLAPGTPVGPRKWLALLWQFLSPDFLFVSGDSSLVNSTRTAGLLPIAFAVLIAWGIWAAVKSKSVLMRIALVGLATAPLASVISGAVEMNRLMFLIPFAAVMAAMGGQSLWRTGWAGRAAAVVLVASVPLQFAMFHNHYLNQYPQQAARWFGGNVRDAIGEASRTEGPSYISARIPFASRYWAFYAPRNRAVTYFDAPPTDAPPGSRLACATGEATCSAVAQTEGWRKVAGIREPSGEESFQVFERQ